MNERKKLLIVSILVIAAICIVGYIDFYNKKITAEYANNTTEKRASDFIVNGEYETKAITYCCPTEADFEKMMTLLGAGDNSGIEAMKWATKIIPLPKGTKVKVISNSISTMKVKILSGFYVNSSVYMMWASLE